MKTANKIMMPNGELIALSGATFEMFDTILKDHILTYEQSKGWALQGTYVYKEAVAGSRYGYPDFYNKCTSEKELGTPTETTLGDSTVTLYVNANGHTFYDIADKEAIDAWYNTYGIAWYYGIDKENERIFLPRTKWFIQPSGEITEVNTVNEAGLPNIEATLAINAPTNTPSGAFYYTSTSISRLGGTQDKTITSTGFDASLSNPIYGNSDTVQPQSINQLLYICVGNTVADISFVDVVTQVENGVKDIDDAVNDGVLRLNSIDSLKTTQLTNCLLEVPQRIKYTLDNGTLTIHAGTVCIVPYGTEDLTSEFPVGSTFLNDNFKVVDTQYMYPQTPTVNGTEGKFFVWVEVMSDIVDTSTNGGTVERSVQLEISETYTYVTETFNTQSSTEEYTGTDNMTTYRTDLNLVQFNIQGTLKSTVGSLPLMRVVANDTGAYGSIKQVFNGLGYIGSTVWVDKGVKGLIPNGRNEDGTLRNDEVVTDKVLTYDAGSLTRTGCLIIITKEQALSWSTTISYEEDLNLYKSKQSGLLYSVVGCGSFNMTDGVISNFQPKQPFRAVDWSDYNNNISTIQTSMIRPPNYSAFIGLTPKTGMVIDEDCWLQIITKHVDRSNTRTMTLDGLPIIRQLSANDNSSSQPDFMCWLGFVKKGSTIAYSGFNSVSMWKVPLL